MIFHYNSSLDTFSAFAILTEVNFWGFDIKIRIGYSLKLKNINI